LSQYLFFDVEVGLRKGMCVKESNGGSYMAVDCVWASMRVDLHNGILLEDVRHMHVAKQGRIRCGLQKPLLHGCHCYDI
jgi:hypothetical protein